MKKAIYLTILVAVCALTDYVALRFGVTMLNISALLIIQAFAVLAVINMKEREAEE